MMAAGSPAGIAVVVLAARTVASRTEVAVMPWAANTVRSFSS